MYSERYLVLYGVLFKQDGDKGRGGHGDQGTDDAGQRGAEQQGG